MNKKPIDQIQELDEEDLANSYAPKSGKKKFNFMEKSNQDDDDREIDTFSNNSNNERAQFLQKEREKQEESSSSGSYHNKAVISKLAKKLNVENEIKEDIVEDQDNDYGISDKRYFGSIIKTETREFNNEYGSRNKKKEKPKIDFSPERVRQYDIIKNQIEQYALIQKKQVSTDNYKQLITEHMRKVEKDEELQNEFENKHQKSETKMISTDIESRIRDHVVNHKIRANQKYQVVKNFFKTWLSNAKEIRRIEKKNSQKQTNNQMVADKILQEEREKLRRKIYEKETFTQIESKKQVKKVKKATSGQIYIKPGFDIKVFIPFCTDIYLGKD